MTLTLAYEVVDVFTEAAFSGNPLAVVLDADDLSTEQLQAIAREFNLSETAFPLKAGEGSSYRLRIFTPSTELPFAGHPSVGTAWVLHRLGRIDAGPNVQECGAGLLPVAVSASGATLTGGAVTLSEPLDPAPLLAAVGLTDKDLVAEPLRAGAGLEWTYLMVLRASLARIQVDHEAVRALGGNGLAVVCSYDGDVRMRVFASGIGVDEDPATGSAALGLGVYFGDSWADGEHAFDVVQGVELGRPSRLSVTVSVAGGRVARTTVTGSVTPVARGEIAVP